MITLLGFLFGFGFTDLIIIEHTEGTWLHQVVLRAGELVGLIIVIRHTMGVPVANHESGLRSNFSNSWRHLNGRETTKNSKTILYSSFQYDKGKAEQQQ